ncbi:hypothetical protein RND71_038298 [Anisodus tanguticus]|uniref:HMG box domain-containing protein n=1 Tax=Anisodus tanguticus TaxID=243964 RepID=A0AAE1R2E0_9SOLA|nr:hypothetical protein RND71_038298 [Anisodus tanguticus]
MKGDKFDVKAYNMIFLKKNAQALEVFKGLVRDLNNPKRPLGAIFAFIEAFKKQFLQLETCSFPHEGDKSDVETNYVFHMKNKAPGLKNVRNFSKGRDKPKRLVSALFIFMDEFSKQFPEMNSSIESIIALGAAGGRKWNQMSDTEKAPNITKEKKMKMEYEKRMNAYNRRVAVANTEEEESDESRSEFDDEEVTGEEDEDDDMCNIFDV